MAFQRMSAPAFTNPFKALPIGFEVLSGGSSVGNFMAVERLPHHRSPVQEP